MLSQNLIKRKHPVLKSNDSIQEALELFHETDFGELPVIEPTTRKLVGFIYQNDLVDINDKTMKLCELDLKEPIKVHGSQHLFEAIRLMLQYELPVLPVVDNEFTFLGLLKKKQLLEVLSDILNLSEYGSVITIELVERDYTLSEIVQIIEVEKARILGITVETPQEINDTFSISIKLNIEDVSRVSAALRRYGYTISSETGNEKYDTDFKARANELLDYLEI